MTSGSVGFLRISFSNCTISWIWERNQGSILERLKTSSDGHAALEGVADGEEALGVRDDELLADLLHGHGLVLAVPAQAEAVLLEGADRLLSASLKVRPIDIVSPTDFIWMPSVALASGNFSKAQRGVLTTT
jgi:hypothetical protein